jgi:hypothetical protein
VQQIFLKQGQHTTFTTVSSLPVASVYASQVEGILLLHSNPLTQPQTFVVAPKSHSFTLKLRKMKATQIPLLLNNATTGHNLQGAGVDSLCVHNWSYVTNLVYAMLSRVKNDRPVGTKRLVTGLV